MQRTQGLPPCTKAALNQMQHTPVGLLDASGGGGGLAGCLGGQLLAGGLAAGGLAGCLLRAGHVALLNVRVQEDSLCRSELG